MSEEKAFALLVDQAKLLKKHGSESFEDLASLIDSQRFRQSLTRILTGTATQARVVGGHRKSKSRASSSDVLPPQVLLKEDPERVAVLTKICQLLSEGRALPRMRDVLDLAEQIGVPLEETRSRKRVVTSLLNLLGSRSVTELEEVLSRIEPRGAGNSLQRWSDIILPKEGGES